MEKEKKIKVRACDNPACPTVEFPATKINTFVTGVLFAVTAGAIGYGIYKLNSK